MYNIIYNILNRVTQHFIENYYYYETCNKIEVEKPIELKVMTTAYSNVLNTCLTVEVPEDENTCLQEEDNVKVQEEDNVKVQEEDNVKVQEEDNVKVQEEINTKNTHLKLLEDFTVKSRTENNIFKNEQHFFTSFEKYCNKKNVLKVSKINKKDVKFYYNVVKC